MDDIEKKTDNNLDFVARHYRDGAFDVDAGWRSVRVRLWQSGARSWRLSRRAAAAIAVGVVLTASACILTWRFVTQSDIQSEVPAAEESVIHSKHAVAEVKRIEFADAPLKDVIQAIERTYGVKVANMPDDDYRLTLSYEGTAADLIATINDLLGIELKIEG